MYELKRNDKYVKKNVVTGEELPLMQRRFVKTEHYFCIYEEGVEDLLTLDGSKLKVFLVACAYVGWCKSADDTKTIGVTDDFVRFAHEKGLEYDAKYFMNRFGELVKQGLLVKISPNYYSVNPKYAFKGKSQVRNKIMKSDITDV